MPMRRIAAGLAVVATLAFAVTALGRPATAQSSSYFVWTAHPPSGPPSGWVYVTYYLGSSGCSGCECSSNWNPGPASGVMEKPGDRTSCARGQGPTSSPWGSTGDGRASCPNGQPAAGTWYHNSTWYVAWSCGITGYQNGIMYGDCYGSWAGPTWEGGNFAEDDNCCDGGTCTPPPGTPGATPTPCACPAGGWSYATPSFSNLATTPPYPVVVGQDPNRKGTTISFRVSLGPATHTWYGPECPSCPAHSETVRDSIVGGAADVVLTQESRNWITNVLGRRYYGARPKHPEWLGQPLTLSGCHYEGDTHVCTASVHVPAEDPGQYDIVATITAGLNGPRNHAPASVGRIRVWMIDTTIWP